MRFQLSLLFFLSLPVLAGPNLPTNALRVPLVSQSTDYTCGPAALLSVFYYWGRFNLLEDEISRRAGTTVEGTDSKGLVQLARTEGLEVEEKSDFTIEELHAHLDQGVPVILDIQAWVEGNAVERPWADQTDFGHYIVLIALDDEYAYFMDPSLPIEYGFIPISELLERWHDNDGSEHYGIAVRGSRPYVKSGKPAKIE
jgi:predicted double-glycine peptidase